MTSDPIHIDSSSERRRHPRWEVETTVKLRDRESGRFLTGQSCDASWSGLRLKMASSEEFEPGQRVDVTLPADSQRGFLRAEAMVPACVVRVDRVSHEMALKLGISEEARQAA